MYRFEFLNKLKAKLGDAVTICDEFDEIHREPLAKKKKGGSLKFHQKIFLEPLI